MKNEKAENQKISLLEVWHGLLVDGRDLFNRG